MTVIAYRDGVLACDTQALSGWAVASLSVVKARKVGRILVAAAGSSALSARFLDWVSAGMTGEPEMGERGNDDYSAVGYLFTPGGRCVSFFPGLPPCLTHAPFYAFGSGGWTALGALAVGATAEQAVAATIEWNRSCGGKVMTWRHDDEARERKARAA